MKKLVLLILPSIFCLCSAVAQNLEWAKKIGSFGYEEGRGIAVDDSGNVYSSGTFFNTVDFDPGPGTLNYASVSSSRDLYITKMDPNGNLIWAKAVGGAETEGVTDLALDVNGNVYVTGSYGSFSCDFDPGPGTFNLGTDGSNDVFILKLDANGNFIFARTITGTVDTEVAFSIAVDAAENVVTTGYITGTADFDPGAGSFPLSATSGQACFVSMLDINGDLQWAKLLEGTFGDHTGYGVAFDASGNVYTTGLFETDIDLNPDFPAINVLTSLGQADIFVSVFDPSGSYLWSAQFGGTGYEYPQNIFVAPSGDIFCIGSTDGTTDFDPGVANYDLTSVGSFDAYVVKLNSAGSFVWANIYGGSLSDGASHISLDAAGNVYLAGGFRGTADLDPGAGTTSFNANGVNQDMYLSKLDASGIFQWARAWGSTGNDYISSLCTGYQSKLYMTGSYENTIDIDPNAGTLNFTMAGGTDTYIMKLNQCVVLPDVELGPDVATCANSYFMGVSAQPNVDYNWTSNPPFFSSTNATETAVPAGMPIMYYLSAMDTIYGCAAIDSINIAIDSISTIALGTDIHSCTPVSTAIGITAEPNVSYSWTSNPPGFTDNTSNPTVSPAMDVPTTYYVTATHANGGCAKTDSILVGYHNSPYWVGSGQTVPLCAGDSMMPIYYLWVVGGTGPYTIDWWNGPDHWYTIDFMYTPTVTRTFTVTISDAYGCNPGSAGVLFVPVNGPNTDLVGHVTTPLPADVTDGSVYAFSHHPGSAGLDTIDIAPLDANGKYVFTGLDNDNYLIKVIPDETTFPLGIPTYFGNTFQWDSSVVVNHGCLQNDTANIQILELPTGPTSIGTGFVSGYVIEGPGFGNARLLGPGTQPNIPFAPGGPLKGVDVKLGKNPGGGIQARVMTDSTGYFEFDSLPLEGYTIYVDIPNLPMDSTRTVDLSTGPTTSVQNNYFADSTNVYIIDTLVAVGIHASEKVYENNFSVFPNPAKDKLNVKFDMNKTSDVSIMLTNALGQQIYDEKLKNVSSGTFTHNIEVSSLNLKAGVYFISVINNGHNYTQRLVVIE